MRIVNNILLDLKMEFKDKKHAEIIYNSILPEIKFAPRDRSKIEANIEDKNIILTVHSTDFIILRAIINSYLRWFNVSTRIINKIKK
ncbi:MAG: hypothetical protein EU549_02585 [Promethearchaeota archaeon]|nr:MAG: hypothetical protein EU549_02585 [Candidatus Lokiarchaeota archaeon]